MRVTVTDLRTAWGFLTKSPLRRQVVGNYALKIINMGLTFAGAVVLARIMGPSQYGVYSFAYSVLMILAIVAEFGLPALVVRETAKGMVRKEYGLVRGVWEWAIKVSGTLSVVLFFCGGLFLLLGGQWLPADRREATLWVLTAIPLLALGDVRNAALRGLGKIISGQLPDLLLRPALLLVLTLVLWGAGEPILGSRGVQLYLLAAGASFLIGILIWYKQIPQGIFRVQSVRISHFWRRSMYSFGVLEIMGVLNLYIATVMQGFFCVPDAQIGVFRIAQQIAQLASFGLVINLVLGPRFATLYEKGDKPGLQRLAMFSARMASLFFLGSGLFFVLFGRVFIQKLFGQKFVGAYTLLLIMLVGQMVNSLVGSVGWILNMANYEKQVALVMTSSVVVNVGLNGVLLPRVGIVGSAVAVSVSTIVWNILLWGLVRKKLGILSLPVYLGKKGESKRNV